MKLLQRKHFSYSNYFWKYPLYIYKVTTQKKISYYTAKIRVIILEISLRFSEGSEPPCPSPAEQPCTAPATGDLPPSQSDAKFLFLWNKYSQDTSEAGMKTLWWEFQLHWPWGNVLSCSDSPCWERLTFWHKAALDDQAIFQPGLCFAWR